MEVKRKKKRALSHKEKFLEYSGTFGAFGRLFQTTAGQTMLQAEKDAVMAKVCTGLSEVCKMLAGEQVEVKQGAVGILVRSLDKEQQEHPEWFEDVVFPDLPAAIPDIQRRIALGSNKVLIETEGGKPCLDAHPATDSSQ